MSGALQAVYQNLRSFGPGGGSQIYTTPGTYTWVVPAGVTKVSVLVVGGGGKGGNWGCYIVCCCAAFCYRSGGGGGGGGLAFKNNISVTPGNSYSVLLTSLAGQKNYFNTSGYLYANNGQAGCVYYPGAAGSSGGCAVSGNYFGGIGGYGQLGYNCSASSGGGGGGAAGYSGNGGNGGAGCSSACTTPANSGAGGGGGGGTKFKGGNGGGGINILGKGTTGAGGIYNQPGAGGSGGCNGVAWVSGTAGAGGYYGGGGGGATPYNGCGGARSAGAVRIIWPGCSRSFPSTNAGSP